MPVIDLGKVVGDPGASMRFRGEWNGGSEYFNNESYIDTVTHHGSLWVCKQTNTGQEPIEGDYWGIGAQGNSDLNASDVTYDNESSDLSSNTVQGAIDEIVEIEKVINGNQADSYSPSETYTAGRLVIQNNALWKAKQDINVAEPWTPAHWDATTIAAELKAQAEDISDLNSRSIMPDFDNIIKSDFSAGESWTATSDCWLVGYLVYETTQKSNDTHIQCGTRYLASCFSSSGESYSSVSIGIKKGETITMGNEGAYEISAYGM